MTNEPLASIGLPVHDGEKYIRRALDSLLAQNYPRFEVLVSDNSSVDGTSEICQGYADRDPRLSYSRTSSYLNSADNFQRVLDLARGPYFMWAACDDWWAADFLAAMVKELQLEPEASVCMSAVERKRESGEPIDIVRYMGSRDPSRMSGPKLAIALARGEPYHLYIYGLYRTEFLRKALVRFPRVAGGDRLFVCQVALATKFCYVDQVLHTRYMSNTPLGERYSNEELGRLWRDPLSSFRLVGHAGSYLLQSRLIPWQYRLWIPLVVVRLALWQFERISVRQGRRLLEAVGLWSAAKRFRDRWRNRSA
jgi:glycosyltransferase involved in cell wall biosynthesis